jgi:hypothetical protein
MVIGLIKIEKIRIPKERPNNKIENVAGLV